MNSLKGGWISPPPTDLPPEIPPVRVRVRPIENEAALKGPPPSEKLSPVFEANSGIDAPDRDKRQAQHDRLRQWDGVYLERHADLVAG